MSRWFTLCLLLLTTLNLRAAELHPIHDLQALGEQARRDGKSILLLVSLEDCPWCERLKEEVLNPMLKSGEYDHWLIIAETSMEAGWELRDFDGTEVDASVWAGNRRIFTSPTLLFLGPDGKERAKRMLGYNSADLFPYYLEEQLQQLPTFPM